MPVDNDGKMLKELSYAFGDLQDKYRDLGPLDRAELRPALEEAFEKYKTYRLMLLGGPSIVTDEDIRNMRTIADEINSAASKQSLITALVKLAGFIAPRII